MTRARALWLPLALAAAACAADGGDRLPAEPWDVTAFVRLTADGTRGLPWPREARDAIATARDGDPATSWKAPENAPSAVEIDLQPWQGRAVPLHELALTPAGSGSATLTVEVRESCGGPLDATLAWPDPASPLALEGLQGGCLTLRVAPDGDFQVTELALRARAVPDRARPRPAAPPLPAGAGVIEAWYGVPWSWREREALLRSMAAQGLDTYIYAPKHDPLHRERWRDPYPPAFEEAFARLAALGTELGVQVVFGLSPFVDMDLASEADYALARDKLRRFVELGAHGVEIGADDSDFNNDLPVDAALGEAHAAIVARLLADLQAVRPGLPCWFMPVPYSTARADGVVDGAPAPRFADGWGYLRALADLPPEVRVMWNGLDTFVASITAADLAPVAEALARPPVIFDNLWANDAGDGFTARLWLAPQQGRDPDVLGASAGYLHNPLIQGALTRWRVGTFGHWLCEAARGAPCGDAEGYAAAAELGARTSRSDAAVDAALLADLARVFDGHGGGRDLRFRPLDEAVTALRAELDAGVPPSAATVAALQETLGRLPGLASEAHHGGLDADLVDELAFPLQKAELVGLAGLASLRLLFDRLGGDEGADAAAALDELLTRLAFQRFDLSEGVPLALAAAVQAAPLGVPGVFSRRLQAAAAPPCAAGAPLRWTPFPGAAVTTVSGLPGARVDGDGIRWTPRHAGSYRATVTGSTATPDGLAEAFGSAGLSLACSP